MEDETSEGEWVPTEREEEETTHPNRSSAEETSLSSSTEDSDERRKREENGPGRIMHISEIMEGLQLQSGIEYSPKISEKTEETETDGTTSVMEEEDDGPCTGRLFLQFYAIIIFAAWVLLAAIVDVKRAAPWIAVFCVWAISFAGYFFSRAFKLRQKWEAYKERQETDRLDKCRFYFGAGLSLSFRLLIVPIVCWIVYDAWGSPIRLRSIGAVLGYVALAIVCSAHPARIKWKPVVGAFTLQLGLGIVLLRWGTGRENLVMVANKVVRFLDFTQNGTAVVYEWIAFPPSICGMGFVFLYTAMQIIIWFGGIVSLLYYCGIIQSVLAKFAIIMQYTLGTTVIESMNAFACIFLGQTESAVLIGPAFETMTSSEITTVMCSGFSCIAGALFSAYISFGACPEYLLSATVMSACVSLGIAKILYPEIQVSSQKNVADMQLAKHDYHSCFDAISKGAIGAAKVVGAIGISLVVYLALLDFINNAVLWLTSRLGYENLSFNDLVGLIFFPLAYMMGASDAEDPEVNRDETLKVAQLMGLKTTVNEFVAYSRLAAMIDGGALKGARAQMVATYALCGFSNIASIGAVLGIMSAMCPRRMRVFSRLAIRALLGGCISCFLTASVAGILVETPASCPPKLFTACLDLGRLAEHLNRTYGLK